MDLANQWHGKPGFTPNLNHHNVSKRISVQRIVTSLLLISVICQFPFVGLAPKSSQVAIFANLIISVLAFSCVIYLSKQGTFLAARFLLIATFVVFIAYSTWLWINDYHTHWFLLLGIVVVTYLFSPKESFWLYASYLAFSTVFLAFELHFLNKSHPLFWPEFRPQNGLKALSNAVFMVIACIAVALNIRGFMDSHWQSLYNRSLSLQSILDRVFPTSFVPENNKLGAQTNYYCNVSVLFIDMASYSKFAATQPIHRHVELLHQAYTMFDRILSEQGIVRVKTNGDQYIAAAGIPCTETESSAAEHTSELPHQRAEQLCHAAIAIQGAFTQVCQAFSFKSQLKMGIASGDVNAGFIGNLRPTFDVWGEPMIIASRLERHCSDNDILVCPKTCELVRGSEIHTAFIGEQNLKGFEHIKVYRLETTLNSG